MVNDIDVIEFIRVLLEEVGVPEEEDINVAFSFNLFGNFDRLVHRCDDENVAVFRETTDEMGVERIHEIEVPTEEWVGVHRMNDDTQLILGVCGEVGVTLRVSNNDPLR